MEVGKYTYGTENIKKFTWVCDDFKLNFEKTN
jgi:hypothetical protein